MPQPLREALRNLVDAGSFEARPDGLAAPDPLAYPEYSSAQQRARDRSGFDESVVAGAAVIGGHAIELGCFDFDFLGGSMGAVAGERLARSMERAATRGVPFVLRASTGGARMQEGMVSLVQIPKLVAARLELADAAQPFLAVLGHPTTGGVLAGLASLADITVAEQGATIGFAGPRVVQHFTGSPPGPESHTAETAFSHGLVDGLASADELRNVLAQALSVLAPEEPAAVTGPGDTDGANELDAWRAVEAARSASRPSAPQLLRGCSDDLIELRGDRMGGDDRSLVTAIARIKGRRALVLALDRSTAPGAGAYRKAARCIDVAERLRIPVVSIIDTRGADPSSESENDGVAWAIGNLYNRMLRVRTPLLAVLTGEGGSGGALAFATADALIAYRASIFSVIAPEAASEILWRDGGRALEAARLLRLKATDLLEMGIADAIVPEPLTPESLGITIAYHLDSISDASPETRRRRWRHIDE